MFVSGLTNGDLVLSGHGFQVRTNRQIITRRTNLVLSEGSQVVQLPTYASEATVVALLRFMHHDGGADPMGNNLHPIDVAGIVTLAADLALKRDDCIRLVALISDRVKTNALVTRAVSVRVRKELAEGSQWHEWMMPVVRRSLCDHIKRLAHGTSDLCVLEGVLQSLDEADDDDDDEAKNWGSLDL